MEKRLLERRTENLPTLHAIRRITEILSSQGGTEPKYDDVALQLLQLASTTRGKYVCHLLGSEEYHNDRFNFDILAASVATNNISMVNRLVNTEPRNSGIFGHPSVIAVAMGNYETLAILLAAPVQRSRLDIPFSIRLLSKAAVTQNLEMFEYLLGSRHLQSFAWLFTAHTRHLSADETARLLHTSSVEIFDIVLEILKARTRFCADGKWVFRVLQCALTYGWENMARHILSSKEPAYKLTMTNSLSGMLLHRACTSGHIEVVKVLREYIKKTNGEGLLAAASHGHMSILEILLEDRAEIKSQHAPNCLYAAARKGFINIVRVLLDSGMDPNAGHRSALIGAIESEHVEIFRLLVERGADVDRALPKARQTAEAAGLDSMIELLGGY